MSQRCASPAPKSNKPICKGHLGWRKVNRLAHRLGSKGVPAPILASMDSTPKLTPQVIATLSFK